MTAKEKSGYIKAVLCLTKKKAISGISGTVNRYDDFHAVHNNQTPNIRESTKEPPTNTANSHRLGQTLHPLASVFRGKLRESSDQ